MWQPPGSPRSTTTDTQPRQWGQPKPGQQSCSAWPSSPGVSRAQPRLPGLPSGLSPGRPCPAPTRLRPRPRGSARSGTGPERGLPQPSTSLQHLEIRKALRETRWKLFLQRQRRSKCTGRTLGLAVSPQGCGHSSEPLPSLQLASARTAASARKHFPAIPICIEAASDKAYGCKNH